MPDINDEMKVAADYAINAAKERFNLDLDYSELSISNLENILGRIYWGFSNRTRVANEDALILKTASIWGSYLGEYMRLKWGGTWILKGSDRIVSINNNEFSPIKLVYQLITSHPEFSIKNYLIESEKKIYTSAVIPQMVQSQPTKISPPIKPTPVKKPEKKATIVERAFFYLAIVGGVLIVILFILIGYKVIKAGGLSAIGSIPSATSSSTPVLLEQANVTAASPTDTPTITPLPTWTPIPTITSRPSSTPSPTGTGTATLTPSETPTPLTPTPTRRPTKTSTPVTPTDTPVPATQVPSATHTPRPSPTATTPAPIVIQSCEVNPSTVPAGINTALTFTAHFSGPGQGFDTQFQANFPGQTGCSATNPNGDVASCDGSSGLLPSSTKVDVVFKSTAGDCTASYRSP